MHRASIRYVQFPLVCTGHQYAMCSSLWYAPGINIIRAVPFGRHRASICYVQFPLVCTGHQYAMCSSLRLARGTLVCTGINMLCAVPFGMHRASICYVQFPLECTGHQYAMCSSRRLTGAPAPASSWGFCGVQLDGSGFKNLATTYGATTQTCSQVYY